MAFSAQLICATLGEGGKNEDTGTGWLYIITALHCSLCSIHTVGNYKLLSLQDLFF